jgi:hypothetical protein
LLDTLQTRLAETFLLGNGTPWVDRRLDIIGNALAVSPYPALQIDQMGGETDGMYTLGALLVLPCEALICLTSHFHYLFDLLEALPALVSLLMVTLHKLAYCSHSSLLLLTLLSWGNYMA